MFKRDFNEAAAPFLAIREPRPGVQPFCDVMSGAIVWPDEVPEEFPPQWGPIRRVWNHRTRVIMGEPSKYRAAWVRAQTLFPEWIGFRPERCEPSEGLIQLYTRWRAEFKEDLRRLEREAGL